ncbi:MAG: GyrI-like domain-containing protein [Rhodothermaceae bacterium]
MDYFERIEKVINFIEENLQKKITLEEVASEACFSKYHFHRIFNAIAGETLGDYVRKRRLTVAAKELLFSNKKIIEVAFDLQFESQSTFTRAFKNMFNLTPGEYRKKGEHLVFSAREPVKLTELKRLHRGFTMKPELKEIEEFTVVGMEKTVTLKTNYLIVELWEKFSQRIDEIKNRIGTEYFEVCKPFEEGEKEKFTEDSEFTKVASVKVSKVEDLPEGMTAVTVPGGKYAVFTHKGKSMEIKSTYEYIWGKWVPSTDLEVDLRYSFELYDERFLGPENPDSEMEIYIPIK